MLEEALEDIKRGISEIIDEERITILLKNYFDKGQNYYVKAGFDPTAPDLHLGHTVLLQKMAIFQKYGGVVQFIIGDFTGMIGDPTGKNETRKKLSREQILKNAKSYEEQVYKILDSSKTEILFNSTWIEALGASGMLELTTTFNVARMLEREDFDKRYKANAPISISEFIYPLLQGYDSVAIKSDIEMGGTDQKFNLLMGRSLQRAYNLGKEQAVIMTPLLEGLDGINKMSKSLGNYIGVTDEPNEMFGKVLSISDDLMWRYYDLLSSLPTSKINSLKQEVSDGSVHPKEVKENLAHEITKRYHGEGAALLAKEEFDKVHSKNQLPSDMELFELSAPIWIAQALVDCKMEPSTSQARRDINQNAVSVNREKIEDEQIKLGIGEYVLQVGKRKFAKLKVI